MIPVAVCGVGEWGVNHLRIFSSLPGVRVSAVCDVNDRALERAVRQFPGIGVTKVAEEAFRTADAVVIASSARTHYALAKQALESGKHVLVEKPLALKVEHGEELVQLAERRNRVLMVGHLLLYHPALLLLKAKIDQGVLGRVLYLHTQRVNLGRIRTDENVVWSLAPHDISMTNFLLGEVPRRVGAWGQAYLQKGIEDVAFLHLEYPNGRVAHIHVSWLDPHKVRKLTIVGEEKMAVFDDMEAEEKLKIYDKGAQPVGDAPMVNISTRYGDIYSPRVEMREPLRLEAEHFIDCIVNGKTPRTDGRQGLEVLRILEAANRSMTAGGKPVELEEAKL